MSVSLVPLIYLNRSDLYVARSANVARYQPYPYRAMLAGPSMPSRPTGSAWRPHQGRAPIAVLIHAIPLRVSTEDIGTAIGGLGQPEAPRDERVGRLAIHRASQEEY